MVEVVPVYHVGVSDEDGLLGYVDFEDVGLDEAWEGDDDLCELEVGLVLVGFNDRARYAGFLDEIR